MLKKGPTFCTPGPYFSHLKGADALEEAETNVVFLQSLVGGHMMKLPLTSFHQGSLSSKVEVLVPWSHM